MTFQIGDEVKWYTRTRDPFVDITHAGTVVGVLPAGVQLADVSMRSPHSWVSLPGYLYVARKHESYIVYVPGATPGSKGRLWWPRASGLRVAS